MSYRKVPLSSRAEKFPHYIHLPALKAARFVFIEQPLWAAGLKWAGRRFHSSRFSRELDVLVGVTRLTHLKAIKVRKTTDGSIVLTATRSYLQSTGKKPGDLIRISMSDIRRAEQNLRGWRNVGR
jgi:hypothetical protein